MPFKSFVFLSLFCGMTVAVFADDQSKTVALAETPAAVQKTIQAQTGDGKLGDIDKTSNDGDSVYDVALTAKDGQERDFTVAEDGTLLNAEVALAETPAPVQKSIKTLLGEGELESIDKKSDGSEITYDVELTAKDGREKDFTLADNGTLLSMEVALSETPDVVQKNIAEQINGGNLESIDKNFDDKKISYDVEATAKDGRKKSFTVSSAGKLSSVEVTLKETTPAAQKTIKARIGDGKMIRIDKSFTDDLGGFKYEIQSRKIGRSYDFSVGQRGRFLGMDN